MTATRPSNPPTIVIEPPRSWSALNISELWRSRELLYFLAWRDVKVRYAQAALGVVWAVLQPLLMMAVFTIFLGRLAKVPSDGVPYPVFAFTGLLTWTFFANALGSATQSLVGSANLVSKVWFPRLVLPVGSMLAWLPDVAIASVLLFGLMILYGMAVPVTALLLPIFVVFALVAAASVGIWFSALNVAYRDIRYAMPFVIQLWLFATPVAYPASLIPEKFRFLMGLNPMAGVVEGFRWALLGQRQPPWELMSVSVVVVLFVLVSGLYYFRRVEHGFADVI